MSQIWIDYCESFKKESLKIRDKMIRVLNNDKEREIFKQFVKNDQSIVFWFVKIDFIQIKILGKWYINGKK